jgi:hypothetical protein
MKGKLNENAQLPIGLEPSLRKPLYDLFQAIARKVNGLSSGAFSAIDGVGTSAPASGTWTKGDFIRNSNPTETGAPLSQYVILGWIRLTDGSANVLNTDWVEVRTLTGN